MDLFPVGRGHLLVVPRQHVMDVFDTDEATLLAVMGNARRLALALRRAFQPDGIGIHQLNGAAAGQTVFHYHLHLIPRMLGDPPGLHGRVEADSARLAEHARRIAEALEAP
jgi:histidine triad (HIT) family protein